jgi:hypothetical protein
LVERDARVRYQRDRRNFVGVELRGVDVDEAHRGILERGHRGRREVGVARADSNHEVGVIRQTIGSQRPRSADRAHALRVVVWQRSLAGLRFRYRDAGLRREGD